MATKKKASAKKKAAAKSKPASKPGSGLTALLKKIQIELENGKKIKFQGKNLAKAKECLSKTGKIKVSFNRVVADGDGGGSGGDGTQYD